MRRHERTSSRQSARADDAAMLPQTVPPVDGHDDVRDGYLQGRKHVALALAVCIIFMAVGLVSSYGFDSGSPSLALLKLVP